MLRARYFGLREWRFESWSGTFSPCLQCGDAGLSVWSGRGGGGGGGGELRLMEVCTHKGTHHSRKLPWQNSEEGPSL